jgi:hypothetical protein
VLDGFEGSFDSSACEAEGASVLRASDVSACSAPLASAWLLLERFAWEALDGSDWRSFAACVVLELPDRRAFAFEACRCIGREAATACFEAMLVSRWIS